MTEQTQSARRRLLVVRAAIVIAVAAVHPGSPLCALEPAKTKTIDSEHKVQPSPLVANRPKVPGVLRINARKRVESPPGSGRIVISEGPIDWHVAETAIVICDMWDDLYCQMAAQRVAEMAPRMNRVLTAARSHGVMIIHAPSGTLDRYTGTPYRVRMQQARKCVPPVALKATCPLDTKREGKLPIDDSQSCDDPIVAPAVRTFKMQHPAIQITGFDGISDSGEEIYNFCRQEGIKNVVLMGVHTNMCVLARSFGIRQMVMVGMNVALARDLTDAMYDPRQPPYVSHARGVELVVEHIERYWCPSIASDDLTHVVPGSDDPQPSSSPAIAPTSAKAMPSGPGQSALAQGAQIGRPISLRPGLMEVALMGPVRKELGIEQEEAKTAEIRKLLTARRREFISSLRNLKGVDLGALALEIDRKLQAKYDPELKKILTPEQFTRVQQISLQMAGAGALEYPDVVQALEITNEQQEKLFALRLEARTKRRELLNPGGNPGSAGKDVRATVLALSVEQDKRIKEILSKAQQEKFAKLKGKPFDLALLRTRPVLTSDTAVVIEMKDPGIQVTVHGEFATTVSSATGPRRDELPVEPGKYQLRIITPVGWFHTKASFSVQKGQKRNIVVSIVDKNVVAKLDNQLMPLTLRTANAR